MNLATIIVLLMIGAALCAAVLSMIRNRRTGKCCGCSGCSHCSNNSSCSDCGNSKKRA